MWPAPWKVWRAACGYAVDASASTMPMSQVGLASPSVSSTGTASGSGTCTPAWVGKHVEKRGGVRDEGPPVLVGEHRPGARSEHDLFDEETGASFEIACVEQRSHVRDDRVHVGQLDSDRQVPSVDAEQRRFVGDGTPDEVGSARSQAERDRSAVRVADEVHDAEVERLDERGEVLFVLTARAPSGRRDAAGMTAAVVGDHPVSFGQDRDDEVPAPMVGPASVDEHDGVFAVAGHLVVEIDVVDALTGHWLSSLCRGPLEWRVRDRRREIGFHDVSREFTPTGGMHRSGATRKGHAMRTTNLSPSTDLHVEHWGVGAPVVLVHGSLATGAQEWEAQRPLADEGFRLTVVDRRGYGQSPAAPGEDFTVDAEDIAALLGDGAHLVGHSYGGLGALLAAAHRPEATLSLTLLEPAVTTCGLDEPAWSSLVDSLRDFWQNRGLSDREWVVEFLVAVGSDPSEFPPEFLAEAAASAPLLRNGRPPFDADLPLDAIRAATYPKLVVSGGHHAGFDAMCLDLAHRIGADNAVVEGAGHEVQFVGEPLNELLGDLWRRSTDQRDERSVIRRSQSNYDTCQAVGCSGR